VLSGPPLPYFIREGWAQRVFNLKGGLFKKGWFILNYYFLFKLFIKLKWFYGLLRGIY
jgi:hypothetical protein